MTEIQHEVAVKALQWTDNRGIGFSAVTVAGIYSIDIGDGKYRVFAPCKWPPVGYASLEAAKAAAQADYETRIRSALESSAPVKALEPVRYCQPNYDGKIHPNKFMVVYEDAEMGNAVFDNEAEAREHFSKASVSWNCYLFGLLPLRSAPVKGETEGWRPMSSAPKDGKHCILAVKSGGGFVYSVQGAFHLGQWNCVMGDNVEPLCWMPNVRIPDEFLPWKNALPASPEQGETDV